MLRSLKQYQIASKVSLLLVSSCIAVFTGCGGNQPSAIESAGPRAFASHQVRYMTPFDLIQLLRTTFPVPDISTIDYNCTRLTEENRGLIGDNPPLTGSPIFDEPSSGFVRWYVGCLDSYIPQYADQNLKDFKVFYGETLGSALEVQSYFMVTPFSKLPPDLQKIVVFEVIEKMIGPDEIIADFGYFAGSDALADHILQSFDLNLPLHEAVKKIHFSVGMRDEFLSY